VKARYDNFHINGYWWAINYGRGDDGPEIVRVFELPGYGISDKVADRLGEADPCDLVEFEPLAPIDTTGWPKLRDADSPKQVLPGHHWAIYDVAITEPEIVKVGNNGEVLRPGQDGVFTLEEFVFIRTIKAGSWLQI
jgi:hypothetical protein